jgi:trigger factor
MVSTEVLTVSNCKKELKITVPVEDISTIREEQFKVVQKEADIQGFRKGHAPKHLVQQYYQGTIEKYTLDAALQKGYEHGLRESAVIPVADPVVKKFDYDDQNNLIMEVEIETFPEIELKKYTGVKIDKEVFKISDDDVDDSIDYIRKQKAIIKPVEEESQAGHFVTLTMQETDEAGLPIVGKKYEDIRIQLGDNKFDADIEKQLIGLKAGDEKTIEKKYDKNFEQKNMAGKTEIFSIKVDKVEEEELPELNDEFVKNLAFEGVSTVEDFKHRVEHNMEAQWGQESEQRFYNKFVQEILQLNPFDVPESVVDRYLDKIVEDIKKRDPKVEEAEVRKNYRVDALFNIKWFYLKDKIAEKENIKAEEEDFQKYLEGVDDAEMKKMYSDNPELKKKVMSDLFEKKMFDYLVDNSKISIKEKSIRKEMGKV